MVLLAALLQADQPASPDPGPGRITLKWRTASEQDNLGFNLYRADTAEGPWRRINEELIPGQGTTSQVHQYEFVDQPVERFRYYYYYLENISTHGVAERYSGTILGIDDRTILGPTRAVGGFDLPLRLQVKERTLEPGRYQIVLQEVVKEVELVNDIGTPEAGRARYLRDNVTHVLLQRGGETVADELAISLPAPPGAGAVEGVLLRSDAAPPAGEPPQLYRLTVRDGNRILRTFFEPAS